ncbi:MAG: hypothetical protein VKJ05_01270 [Synechococcaceae cyanobacterium]|nr:hypothetical protein [Synechococcaceae cyanobacterium]
MPPTSRGTLPGSSSRTSPEAGAAATAPAFSGSFADLKERQLVFLLVRQLAEAQFVRADQTASERLWQEVAALEIDPERITALLYQSPDLTDTGAMERLDREFRCAALPRSRGWFGGLVGAGTPELRPRSRGAWHRTAPRATPPARPAAR